MLMDFRYLFTSAFKRVGLALGFTGFFALHGQSLKTQAISCFGGSVRFDSKTTIQMIAGQPSNTTVVSDNGVVMRQGFLQPPGFFLEKAVIHINIFPNPTSDFIQIAGEVMKGDEISIYDANGRTIEKQIIIDADAIVKLPLASKNTGVYLLSISRSGVVIKSEKIIKI
jgi:hypothetical protein